MIISPVCLVSATRPPQEAVTVHSRTPPLPLRRSSAVAGARGLAAPAAHGGHHRGEPHGLVSHRVRVRGSLLLLLTLLALHTHYLTLCAFSMQ